ncbi:MAG: DUF1512 family protein [Candidatus Aenigmarchaeota archaeon]|nr:DUF1512 family protein [Candidatus Aenigmarchaeota archaeon]MDI6721936.1 DUF1512 family protein [Candidatus Aenigmarchaeota archaeon]
MVMFAQSSDIIGTVVWFLLFFVMIFLYPRLMLSQLLYKIEQSAAKMERMSDDSIRMVVKKIGRTDKETKQKVEAFTDFFVVEPSSLDPYGIVKKIDYTIRSMESRFDEFAGEIAPDKGYAEKQQLNYGLRAAMGLRQISKIVRHNVELAKKFKNLQIAMILQMQLPIIEKIAESELKGTEAFVNNWPIGDSIGPLVAASLMEKSKEIAEDVSMDETRIEGRKCFVLKAKGNGPHLGRMDEAITKIMKRHKISRIITIDAALKLEGEKSGSVAEGTGFAMGGWGQREMIENALFPKKMPIDSIVVKVGFTEAIIPMRKDVYDSLPKVQEYIKKAVRRTKKTDKLIVIGVGNSSGIESNKKVVEDVKKLVDRFEAKMKKEESSNKKRKWI